MNLFKSKLQKKIDACFERTKFYIDLGENIDVPDYMSSKPTERGFEATYQLPLGMTKERIEKATEALSVSLNADIEWRLDGRIFHITGYTQKIKAQRHPLSVGHVAPLVHVGHSRRGPEMMDYAKIASPMSLICGATGYGKSKLLDYILIQLLYQDAELYIGDPKLDFGHFAKHSHYETEPEDIRDMVEHVSGKIVSRIRWIKAKGYNNIVEYNRNEKDKMEYIYLIVDEALDFSIKDEEFWEPITHIARKGRSAGIYVFLSVQRAANDSFPLVVRNNIGQRICLRVENESDSQVVLGTSAAYHLPPIPGRALIKTDRIREMQIPLITTKEIESVIHEIEKRANS